MIEAESFIITAKSHGFKNYTGVPCSFLTPFINYVINDKKLNYIGSANEGDAVATSAGMLIGGQRTIVMLQNSGLGNAVNPLTSLLHTFNLPALIIITLRGDPALKDEPQHELMGKITGDLLDLLDIKWEYFPDNSTDVKIGVERAVKHITDQNLPYAFIMKKGSVKNEPLNFRPENAKNKSKSLYTESHSKIDNLPSRQEALELILENSKIENSIIVASTGYTGRELYAINDRVNHLYMVGSMGCASSLGLGIAIAQPEKTVIVIEGDGSALMRMGNFATIGHYAGNNFIHIVLDNEIHDSTGGQATVSQDINFAKIAQACNYPVACYGNNLDLIQNLFDENTEIGPKFVHLKIKTGTMSNLPRPDVPPPEIVRRLMTHLGTSV